MVIYQALDELDYPIDNYLEMIVAVQTLEDLKHWQFENKFAEDLSWIGVA